MAEVVQRDPHLVDVMVLAQRMRRADIEEVHASGHYDLEHVICQSIAASLWSKAVHIDGELACIFGVAPKAGRLLGDVGVPWLLGTPTLVRHRGAFMRGARHYIAEMLRVYPVLENHVYEGNTVAIAWLRRMGFALADAEVRRTGARFIKFWMEA